MSKEVIQARAGVVRFPISPCARNTRRGFGITTQGFLILGPADHPGRSGYSAGVERGAAGRTGRKARGICAIASAGQSGCSRSRMVKSSQLGIASRPSRGHAGGLCRARERGKRSVMAGSRRRAAPHPVLLAIRKLGGK